MLCGDQSKYGILQGTYNSRQPGGGAGSAAVMCSDATATVSNRVIERRRKAAWHQRLGGLADREVTVASASCACHGFVMCDFISHRREEQHARGEEDVELHSALVACDLATKV